MADDRQPSAVETRAAELGHNDLLARLRRIAKRHELGTRDFKESLMITAPGSKSRALLNVHFSDAELVSVSISDRWWSEIYSVRDETIADRLLRPSKGERLSRTEAAAFLDRLDVFLGEIAPITEPTGDDLARVVQWLEAEEGADASAQDVANALAITKDRATRLLSSLVSSSCPAKYQGRVLRSARGRYRAAKRRID